MSYSWSPRISEGPGGSRSKANREQAQTFIIERNLSIHRQLNQQYSTKHQNERSNNGKNGSSNDKPKQQGVLHRSFSAASVQTESTPLLLLLQQQQQQQQQRNHCTSPFRTNESNQDDVSSTIRCTSSFRTNESVQDDVSNTIRFQVVLWHIGQIDMVRGRIPVTFRVTIFWNAPDLEDPNNNHAGLDVDDAVSLSSNKSQPHWVMYGRQKAVQTEQKEVLLQAVEVPPVSILNVETFDTIGNPEVTLLQEKTRLMRWTCMYRATIFEEQWEVENFPHDEHQICIKLAVLAHRQPGSTWDRNIWKLGLATEDDSQGSIRVPHGLIVDHVTIPDFSYDKTEGLQFEIGPLDHGITGGSYTNQNNKGEQEQCLNIKLNVVRNSGYYDRNIMPLLGTLNLVAISINALEPSHFFQRALLTLNITFVEIGMRMTADSKLPSSSYQIKMQRILNEYFYGLLFLVLESLLVYELDEWGFKRTDLIDLLAASLIFMHNAITLYMYYSEARRLRNKISHATRKSW